MLFHFYIHRHITVFAELELTQEKKAITTDAGGKNFVLCSFIFHLRMCDIFFRCLTDSHDTHKDICACATLMTKPSSYHFFIFTFFLLISLFISIKNCLCLNEKQLEDGDMFAANV